ncbi:MAG: PriCT-2 domain-containing protein [Methylotenera sp.]
MLALSNTHSKSFVPSSSLRQSALDWYDRGYKIIPLIPGTKKPAVKWGPSEAELSRQAITSYWLQNPTHELSFIVGDDYIVFDADSPESIAALVEIENAFDIKPNLIVKTNKGVHHHFKRAKGTVAKSDAHCTEKFPARIDVKTGRALVILPPSTGKFILLNEAENASDLTEVGQDFIDAINRHNGRNERQSSGSSALTIRKPSNSKNGYFGLKALLEHIDPNCGYDDWLRVLAGIFNHTGGTEYGLEIAIDWSSKWKDYKDENETIDKWRSFNLDHPRPVTIGTIISMVDNGYEIYITAEEPFENISDAVGGA